MRYSPTATRFLRSAALLLGLSTMLVAGTARPAPPAPDLVEAAEILPRIQTWRDRLAARQEAMETRWSYTGARRTIQEAFTRAGLPDATVRRASAWANRLYVLWGDLKPWYARHGEALADLAAVVRDQGGATTHDVAWVERQAERLWRRTSHLETGLEVLLGLRVERAETAVALARLKSRTKRGGEALQHLGGSTGGSLAEARARAAALAASEAWLADALLEDAETTVVPPLEPLAERSRHRIGRLHLVAAEAPGSPESSAPDPGGVAGATVCAAVAADAIARGREAAAIHARDAEAAQDRAADVRASMKSVRRASDLPAVRDLMAREREIQAHVRALRQEIKETDLDAPGGQERARRLAEEVLSLREDLPPVRRRLTRLRSDDHLASWREDRRRALAAALADRDAARRARIDALAHAATASRTLVLAEAVRRAEDARSLLRRLDALERAAARRPRVTALTLRAGEREVFAARRVDTDSLAELRREIRTALDRALALLALSREAGARTVDAAREASLYKTRRSDEAPAIVQRDSLGSLVRRLGVERIVGEDLLAVRGKSLAARYTKLSRAVPAAEALLSERVAPDPDDALARFRGALSEEPERTPVSADTLEEVRERLRTLAGPSGERLPPRLEGILQRVPATHPAAEREATARRRLARLHAAALLWQPLAAEADRALAHTTWSLAEAVRKADERLAPYDTRHAFATTPGPSFLAGVPLIAEVTLAAQADAPQSVRLGGVSLAPASDEPTSPTRRYALDRADGLAGGAEPLALELPAPPHTP
ncbi:MAG: hypothetical protein ACQEXJ_07815 [Myxococcota bacterium]